MEEHVTLRKALGRSNTNLQFRLALPAGNVNCKRLFGTSFSRLLGHCGTREFVVEPREGRGYRQAHPSETTHVGGEWNETSTKSVPLDRSCRAFAWFCVAKRAAKSTRYHSLCCLSRMRSRVRVPSSPPANLIRNKHIRSLAQLQQLQLGHTGPQPLLNCGLFLDPLASSETKSGFRSCSWPRAAGPPVRACTFDLCSAWSDLAVAS